MIFGNLVNLIDNHCGRCMKTAKASDDNGLRIPIELEFRQPCRIEVEKERFMNQGLVKYCPATVCVEPSDSFGNA